MKAMFALALLAAAAAPAVAQQRDARGNVVQSQEATPPAGVNQVPTVPQGAQVVYAADQQAHFATQPSTTSYPPCDRGQTDRCVQNYERPRR